MSKAGEQHIQRREKALFGLGIVVAVGGLGLVNYEPIHPDTLTDVQLYALEQDCLKEQGSNQDILCDAYDSAKHRYDSNRFQTIAEYLIVIGGAALTLHTGKKMDDLQALNTEYENLLRDPRYYRDGPEVA